MAGTHRYAVMPDDGGAMEDEGGQRPENVRFLSGVIVVSGQPERLAAFYRDVLGLPLAEERHDDTALHWACELGDVHFAIHPVEDYPEEPVISGAVKIAFMIFNMAAVVQWLEKCSVPIVYPPVEFGTESHIMAIRDPDGNLVELTELGPVWLDHLKEHRAAEGDLLQVWQARLNG
jgi:catechol 2,3-dioxygenase-like lactoylglutathione lyase family enzyme